MYKLAIVTTHPIQYNAPWFALLNGKPGVKTKVFYTWSQRRHDTYDRAFGQEIRWDIPLLMGYDHQFVENRSADPGNHQFRGIDCPSLTVEIKNWGATHILVFGWNFRAHLSVMRHFKGKIPVLFRGDSTLLNRTGKLRSLGRYMFLRWVYRFVDFALYTGQANKAYFRRFGLGEQHLVFAPHAVDNHRFQVDHRKHLDEAGNLKKKLGIGTDRKVILFVGKFEPVKDPFLLLHAFKILVSALEENKIELIMVGQGELEGSLKDQARGFEGIHFLPFQNQSKMPVIYRLGDILCLPSASETWGLVVNEAMASGTRCLVSSKVGCGPDLGVYPGNRIFRSGDSRDLARKLKEMLQEETFDNKEFLSMWNFEKLVEGVQMALGSN